MITRRTFQVGLIAGLATLWTSLAGSTGTVEARKSYTYRYRYRHIARNGRFRAWFRVKAVHDLQADVPFSVVIATDPKGTNVIATARYVSRVNHAHCTRANIRLAAEGSGARSDLYYRLLLGAEEIPSRAIKVTVAG